MTFLTAIGMSYFDLFLTTSALKLDLDIMKMYLCFVQMVFQDIKSTKFPNGLFLPKGVNLKIAVYPFKTELDCNSRIITGV